jgi:multimeric flavodoxin WrbA
MMASQAKALFDATGQLWSSGALVGKPAAVFVSTATQVGVLMVHLHFWIGNSEGARKGRHLEKQHYPFASGGRRAGACCQQIIYVNTACCAMQGGGIETTAMTAVTQFAHHGMIFVPCGYAFGEFLWQNWMPAAFWWKLQAWPNLVF